jgi:Na+/proline symporter
MGYGRFAAMIATSTIVMFGLMYLNTYALQHIEFSQTRMWMALVMGAVMALVMIGFMWSMYENRRANLAIVTAAVVVFGVALWLVRSQQTVSDVSYMRAMIPHHSIAIMTSERAHIRDPQVRLLADRIIDAQVREIAEMKRHIARLEANPTPPGAPDLLSYRDRRAPPPPGETSAEAGVDTGRTPTF